jgi:hypothetical protein
MVDKPNPPNPSNPSLSRGESTLGERESLDSSSLGVEVSCCRPVKAGYHKYQSNWLFWKRGVMWG